MNTKPYIRSVYFKRLHFSKTVETYYTAEGEKHHREKQRQKKGQQNKKKGQHISQDKKNIQETKFFLIQLFKIYTTESLWKTKQGEKYHALYN